MAFRGCLALMFVLYTALFLIQMEVCLASNETSTSNTTITNTTITNTTITTNTTVSANTTVTESPATTPSSGSSFGVFSMLSFAIYALCSALVAFM